MNLRAGSPCNSCVQFLCWTFWTSSRDASVCRSGTNLIIMLKAAQRSMEGQRAARSTTTAPGTSQSRTGAFCDCFHVLAGWRKSLPTILSRQRPNEDSTAWCSTLPVPKTASRNYLKDVSLKFATLRHTSKKLRYLLPCVQSGCLAQSLEHRVDFPSFYGIFIAISEGC